MKIGMLILGIIGALIALVGSIVTMIGGFGGTAVAAMADNSHAASNGAYVFWSGALAVLVSTLALTFSITGGVAKKKNAIHTFALATLLSGLLSIYLYNWFSGALITIAGILGMVGAKEGIDEQIPLKRSMMFKVVLVGMVLLAIIAAVFKNGTAILESSKDQVNPLHPSEIQRGEATTQEGSTFNQTAIPTSAPQNEPNIQDVEKVYGQYHGTKATITLEMGHRGEGLMKSSLCEKEALENSSDLAGRWSDSKETVVIFTNPDLGTIDVESTNPCFPDGRYTK